MRICTLIILLLSISYVSAQVVVRCPDNNFNNFAKTNNKFRCVPTEESALDSVHITPCDCDDQRNVYGFTNLCYRQISLCTDSLIFPEAIEAFDFPYFDIEPSSISNLRSQNGLSILSEWDPEFTLDPFEANPDAALLVEIDTMSKCAILEAWTPMGQTGGMIVSHELGDNTEGSSTLVILPDDDNCDRFRERCFRVASTHTPLPISANGFPATSTLVTPFPGSISSISIVNINVTHTNVQELRCRLRENLNGTSLEVFNLICPSNNEINFGFSDDASSLVDCSSSAQDIYLPQESFSKIYFTDLGDPDFNTLSLELTDEFPLNGVDDGMLISWEVEVCIQELVCGPFEVSTDTPLSVGPNAGTITTSEIMINDIGKITDLNIRNLDITHTWIGDLTISLTSPEGTQVIVYDQGCNPGVEFQDIHTSFDDEATLEGLPCPPLDSLFSISPSNPLSAFDGEEAQGMWTLTITDNVGGDGGDLHDWALEICTRCPEEYTIIRNNEIQGTAIRKMVYDTEGQIESRELIHTDGDTITYSSGTTTSLLKSFAVDTGSVFQVLREGCMDN